MKLQLRTTLALLTALIGGVTLGQAYNLKSLTSRDGLTNSAILSFGQTESGLMLIGTCDGVNCFDGTRIFPLPSVNGKSVKGNVIENIVVDRNNRGWILTNHGLSTILRTKEPLNMPRFRSARGIKLNAEGRLTVLQDSSLYYNIGNDTIFVRLPLKGGDMADQVLDFSMSSNYFYLFKNGGILRYAIRRDGDNYTLGQRTELSHEKLMMANSDDVDEMMLGGDGQLWKLELETGRRQELVNLSAEIDERGTVSSIRSMGNRLFVCFAASGVVVLEHRGEGYEKYDLGLNVGILSSFKSQGDDMMWIGTDGQGILIFVDEAETRRSVTTDVLRLRQKKPYRAIYKDADGTLWAGTKGDGLLEIPHFNLNDIHDNLDRRFLRRENSGLTGNSVFALQPSGIFDGFWIATNGGLSFRSRISGQIVAVATEQPVEWVSAVCERGDTLWLTTQGMGIYRGIIGGTATAPRLTSMHHYVIDGGKKTSNYFFSMASSPNGGKLYFGNRGMGLYYLQNDILKWVKPDVESDDDIGLQDIFAIHPTKEGVWVGTNSGLSYHDLDKGTTEFFSTANGLPSNVIHALAEDASGNVWVSTNKGLVRILNDTHAIRVYGERDNMEINEYADGAAYAAGDTVFFGGINGISVIVGASAHSEHRAHPQFEFTGLSILGQPVNINEFLTFDGDRQTLTLSYEQNTLKLLMSNFDFKSPGKHIYYYSFSKDGPWINNGFSSEISLTQLSPGHHMLYVKSQNRVTGEYQPIRMLQIHITPPWYLSWWAKMGYLFAAAAVAYLLYRRWKLSAERRRLIREAREEQDRRDEIYEQKMHFLTNLVHELNTPLTLVYGPCERILSHSGTDNFVRTYVRIIQTNMGRLNNLIKEIIDLRRMTTGGEQLRIRAVAVGEWVSEMYRAFSEMAEENNIVYEDDIDKQIVWNLDEKLLIRICSNLISNAFKYSKTGATVRVGLHRSDYGQLVLSVYNTGKGISKDDQKRIFDYYTVLDNVDESSISGLTSRNGLGMAICYSAVTRLGGTISIDSKENEYACFIVKLPWNELPEGSDSVPLPPAINTQLINDGGKLQDKPEAESSLHQQPAADDQQPQPAHPRIPRSPHAHREGLPTVLAIDDNPDILDLLEDTLAGDYNVVTAENGEQGMDIVKRMMPDLIVTDIMMPGMDGLELTQQLKQNKHTMHIPLIILSARRSDADQVEGLESGADAYVSKPFSTQYLLATVARLLENRKVLKEYFNSSASAFTYQDGKLMTGEERQFREEVKEVISKNIKNADFTPEDLARELAISQRNLYRKFSDAGLPTPKEYIKQFKMEFAARLLDTTNLTIQEIIYSSGFNTRSQFYTEFRKRYGITPKDYREQRRVRDNSLE